MKKILIIFMLGILIVGGVVAGVISNINKEIGLSKQAKDWYDDNGISVSYVDYTDGKRCLISNTDFNLPCSATGFTEKELNAWQVDRLEKIALKQIERANRIPPEVSQVGNINLNPIK